MQGLLLRNVGLVSNRVVEFMFMKTRLALDLVAVILVSEFFFGKLKIITAEEFRMLSEEFIRVAVFIDFANALGPGVLLHVVPALHVLINIIFLHFKNKNIAYSLCWFPSA